MSELTSDQRQRFETIASAHRRAWEDAKRELGPSAPLRKLIQRAQEIVYERAKKAKP